MIHLAFADSHGSDLYTKELLGCWWFNSVNQVIDSLPHFCSYIYIRSFKYILCYLHVHILYIYILYTWNPNDPCFDWKKPCFGGVKAMKAKNRGQTNRFQVYIYICINVYTINISDVPGLETPSLRWDSKFDMDKHPSLQIAHQNCSIACQLSCDYLLQVTFIGQVSYNQLVGCWPVPEVSRWRRMVKFQWDSKGVCFPDTWKIRMFPKIGEPQNGWFITLLQWDDLGVSIGDLEFPL